MQREHHIKQTDMRLFIPILFFVLAFLFHSLFFNIYFSGISFAGSQDTFFHISEPFSYFCSIILTFGPFIAGKFPRIDGSSVANVFMVKLAFSKITRRNTKAVESYLHLLILQHQMWKKRFIFFYDFFFFQFLLIFLSIAVHSRYNEQS